MKESLDTLRKDFNYYIVNFFLKNVRLTLLVLGFLLCLALISLSSLRTTGFPSPSLGIAIIRTIYPGASPEVIVKDVTKPIEAAIKDIEGIDSYSSTSSNSVSIVSIVFKTGINEDALVSKLDSAINSISFPTDVTKPIVNKLSITGTDIQLSILASDFNQAYNVTQNVINSVNQVSGILEVKQQVPLTKYLKVSLDLDKLASLGMSADTVSKAIKTMGEVIPVVNNVSLDNVKSSIQTSLNTNDLAALQELKLTANTPFGPTSIKLNEVASIQTVVDFGESQVPEIAWYNATAGKAVTAPAVTLQIRASAGVDLAAFTKNIETAIQNINGVKYIQNSNELPATIESPLIIKNFTANDQNQDQVSEVVSGLIGGPLAGIENQTLSQVGWLLGGIQLVFLAMLFLVSARAAIIASLAIPLSLIFSTIYIFLIGEQLNTLVLFSLVLVIGLVVDPALVVLESIQRKIDVGLKGKQAILAAISDVGIGLFLASLTNIIVFAPFGLISGILGQVFSYIPLTIIPATIGSYIVPLVFLSWFGGYFLKRNKKSKGTEVENLWPIAKKLISLNLSILNSKWYVRMGLIIMFILIPLAVSGFYFGTSQIKVVQFASSDNADSLQATISFKSSTTSAQATELTNQMLQILASSPDVSQVYKQDSAYIVSLNPASKRTQVSKDLAADLYKQIKEKLGDSIYDSKVSVLSVGPGGGNYELSYAAKSEDNSKLKPAAAYLSSVINKLCYQDKKLIINAECSIENKAVVKINDGYTDLSTQSWNVQLDRDKAIANNIVIPNAPVTILANSAIRQLFNAGSNEAVTKIQVENTELNVYLDKLAADATTIDQVKNLSLRSLAGASVNLADVATINSTQVASSILRLESETQTVVQARLTSNLAGSQIYTGQANSLILDYIKNDSSSEFTSLGLQPEAFGVYSQGGSAGFTKSFNELVTTLLLAIIITYIVLAIFFNSLLQPFVVLFTIPLTFIGIFPALTAFVGGQFGFLEIIGLIILVGIVENVAIFLIDAARQLIKSGMEQKEAIATAAGLRMRSVVLTNITAMASLAPLALFSEFYRSIAVVIMFGLLTSGITSLITTPLLWVTLNNFGGKIKGRIRKLAA